ncbi:AbrB family transcriptional regulator [Oceanobacillus bengalensis]|uniref:AbrB family transcriptional regulator n=1 Tax=Oceanobacillus bengalensis TaxID=1435466 RepID=A0A494Z053_9BACI|nr:AbrB family transcriptional regulator [Oceanobacillus bengalensis]RKQ15894.1 AbrB family transcriptional regulator [Oceanobacillus bengalensis]
MVDSKVVRFLITIMIASAGGYLFYLINFPLPWVLGSLTFVMLYQGITNKEALLPISVRNGGFLILGLYFGLYFTKDTFTTIVPYVIPYLLLTILLILISIFLGALVSKWIHVDKMTSIFSSIPGGLSEMAIASEAMKANAALVVIFHTVRLITVLFTIPTFLTFLFVEERQVGGIIETSGLETSIWNNLWFVIPILAALFLKNRIPAGIIIGALGVTAMMNVSPIDLPSISPFLMNAAQIAVGAGLGKNILFRDLKVGGKYTLVYFSISITVIIISFGMGALLATVTSLDYQTAILGMAPGGFFEMVLTSYNIGGDPAIVSAFQLMRILLIVICVPSGLKWWFSRYGGEQIKLSSEG